MGLLVNGQWHDQWYDTATTGGRFVRNDAQFRNWVTSDGQSGPTGSGGFRAEPGRYHLYVSLACPWAHRTLIFRKLKGLDSLISVSVVHWLMGADGWTFADAEGVVSDTINGAKLLRQVYTAAHPDYTGRVTVPVLWDKTTSIIVNNESAEIIRMFNSAFDQCGYKTSDCLFSAEDRPFQVRDCFLSRSSIKIEAAAARNLSTWSSISELTSGNAEWLRRLRASSGIEIAKRE
jgi:putative glutathione S-transferase